MKPTWWYCFKCYWRGWSYLIHPLPQSWFVRTPLFAVGHVKNCPVQNREGRWTGWGISWIPTRWSLRFSFDSTLYRHDWDNYQKVQVLD